MSSSSPHVGGVAVAGCAPCGVWGLFVSFGV
nr:MAG TPA: hypothetical protein [Caudoviricetes sp.]